ncbi:MAG: hypothetical protein AVDCRST_MAG71-2370, partial [uncultured Lysobacter sp.]
DASPFRRRHGRQQRTGHGDPGCTAAHALPGKQRWRTPALPPAPFRRARRGSRLCRVPGPGNGRGGSRTHRRRARLPAPLQRDADAGHEL